MTPSGQNPVKSSGYNHISGGITDFANGVVKAFVIRETRTRAQVLRMAVQYWAERHGIAKKGKA